MQIWRLIPSLGCQYEIDQSGNVRDCYTQKVCTRILHPSGAEQVRIKFKGRTTSRSVKKLLLEVLGIEYINRNCKPCTAHKSGVVKEFESLKQCADFLLENCKYAYRTIDEKLINKEPYIAGWQIDYHEGE